MNINRVRAEHLLQFYMQTAFTAAGKRWDGDNDVEVALIIEHIIDAARESPTRRDVATQARYVRADLSYAECVVTLVPHGPNGARVYEGRQGVSGVVFVGSYDAARRYAQDRHGDLTSSGWALITERQG